MNKIYFLLVLGLQLFNSGCAQSAILPDQILPKAEDHLIISQGLTNSTSTQIAIITRQPQIQVKITNQTSQKEVKSLDIESINPLAPDSNGWVIHHISIQNLVAGPKYKLEVQDQNGLSLDHRTFSTLRTTSKNLRVAVGSCSYDKFEKEQVVIWERLANEKPDLFFWLGDTSYADKFPDRLLKTPTPNELFARYIQSASRLQYFNLPHLIPTLAVWDDHDFGGNDSDQKYPQKDKALAIFKAFFAQSPKTTVTEFQVGPGNASAFTWHGVSFFLLDNRSFRSSCRNPNEPESHFGQKQTDWLFQNLDKKRQLSLIMSGDQFFGGYHRFDSFEGCHPKAFADFKDRLKTLKQRVLLVSGDRHVTEVMKLSPADIGQTTYEITTSPLHSTLHPSNWATIPNSRQIAGQDLKYQFAIFDFQINAKSNKRVHFKSVGADPNPYIDLQLTF